MSHDKRPRIPRGSRGDGAALWSYGFRPFFLGGAIWAVAAMALWIAALAHGLPLGGDLGAPLWHAHEMVFGFASAVLAGFLLTAIPNWTGSLPVSGQPLIGLVAIWAAGRAAMAGAGIIGLPLAAGIDAAFLPALLAIASREIVAGRKWNDLKVLAGCAAIMAGNLGFHAAVLTGGNPQAWLRAAVSGYVVLVLIIGGRIIPSFTRNWLSQRGAARMPVPFNRFDMGVIACSAGALAAWTVAPEGRVTLALALVAAALNAARLARWRGLAVRAEPLLLVLHGAYGFVPLGFAAIAAAGAGWLLPVSALHVLTVGVIATTMLAVMTRATRGHTGQALTASRWTMAAYLCLFAAALARPLADLTGTMGLMEASGALWIAGFGLFIIEHGPMLLRVRRQPRRAPA
ncbi:short-chain dehydrogenase [Paracoccus sp. YIM 132242]|uniref:Short-chain dehydrogenase n=1 Tax=Paracoccus lichenicola TaxID=2665644 RepID=A0A6L6HV12_9RHOB|nr:NnrS family protein [Paracoccus lichenicola]MTE01885.1 short-chain dehydrogenase [Paracoccus lichenicola]